MYLFRSISIFLQITRNLFTSFFFTFNSFNALKVKLPGQTCEDDQFKCSDGTFIQCSWKCDNETDCNDNIDEQGCGM